MSPDGKWAPMVSSGRVANAGSGGSGARDPAPGIVFYLGPRDHGSVDVTCMCVVLCACCADDVWMCFFKFQREIGDLILRPFLRRNDKLECGGLVIPLRLLVASYLTSIRKRSWGPMVAFRTGAFATSFFS